MNCGVVAGLLLGGPRLLAGQQVVLGHRPPAGRSLQECGLAALAAQPRPEEGHMELHPLRVGNTVRNTFPCFFFFLTDLNRIRLSWCVFFSLSRLVVAERCVGLRPQVRRLRLRRSEPAAGARLEALHQSRGLLPGRHQTPGVSLQHGSPEDVRTGKKTPSNSPAAHKYLVFSFLTR